MLDFNLGVLNNIGVRLGMLPHPVAVAGAAEHRDGGRDPGGDVAGISVLRGDAAGRAAGDPGELYEAAAIDGAGAWAQVPPHHAARASPAVIATALLLRMIWVANSLDLILVMTGGGPGTATQTLPLHAFLTAWSGGNYGQGSALAVLLTLLLLGVVVAYLWRSRER